MSHVGPSRSCRRSAPSPSFGASLILCSVLVMERGSVEALCIDSPASLRSRPFYSGYLDDSRRISLGARSTSCIGSRSRCNCRYLPQKPQSFGLHGSREDQTLAGNTTVVDANEDNTLKEPTTSTNDEDTHASNNINAAEGPSQMATDSAIDAPTPSKWEANDFEIDYQLLQRAMSRQSAVANLQQQQRKYTLDCGFARNRRPLIRDALQSTAKIGLWTLFLTGTSGGTLGAPTRTLNQLLLSWRCKVSRTIHAMTTLHHWLVGMILPLLLLALVKREMMGPEGRPLEEYFAARGRDDVPTFFYTTEASKKNAKDKDTGNFVLCLLENWSSAVVLPFALGVCSMLASIGQLGLNAGGVAIASSKVHACTRLLTRLGIAAALHQYPSLLFELRRGDQPRPLCRPTTYTQNAVQLLLRWLPLGVATDLALIFRSSREFSRIGTGTLVASLIAAIAPVCHLAALARILVVSKCSAVSLSEATTFPGVDNQQQRDNDATIDERRRVKWRYQLRWRTPQRLAKTLQSWSNYFFTGHGPLLFAMDDRKRQPIQFDEFSTEGAYNSGKKGNSDADNLTPHADQIAESLSLIFRDRDAALRNATQSRAIKHQESYDTKTLDDVLGVAVQQTFDVGISYDFDHFDSPEEGDGVSIHQLRARLAKSAVRRKRELDGAMNTELEVLSRLKDNVVTTANKELAEKEMKLTEQDIRERRDNQVDRMRNALLTLIPTNADDLPKGTERYDNPMMVSEYVNLTAPFQPAGELKATIGDAPDPLSALEDYVRRDFGDEAADAYRQDELAAREKEQDLLTNFRSQYGQLEDGEVVDTQ